MADVEPPTPGAPMGKRVLIDPKVSIGSLINAAVIVVSVVAFFIYMDAGQRALKESFVEFKADVKGFMTEVRLALDRKADRRELP